VEDKSRCSIQNAASNPCLVWASRACAFPLDQATLDPVRSPLYGRTHSSMWMKNQYTFEVDDRATKTDIRSFLEAVFQVRVVSVNTWRLPNKKTRRGGSEGVRVRRKRATATVAWGQRMRVYPDPKSYIND
jgi:large subunit ribosomal protein L23